LPSKNNDLLNERERQHLSDLEIEVDGERHEEDFAIPIGLPMY
jgi:uncharacterized OsmC-like protein